MVWGVERFYMRLSDGSLANAQQYSVLQNESLCYSSLGSGDARLQTLVHGRKCEVSGGFWFSGFILTPTQSKHAENSTAAPLSAAWHTWKESDSTPPVIYWPSRWASRFLFWKGEKKKKPLKIELLSQLRLMVRKYTPSKWSAFLSHLWDQ